MRLNAVLHVATLGVLLAACGGGEPKADTPDQPAAAATATATATAAAEAEPEVVNSRVDLLEGENAQPPKRAIRARIDTPGNDQSVSSFSAQKYRVRFNVTNWRSLAEGSYVQLVLDNVPFRPITDLKEKITLKDLTEGGADIAAGEHTLAMFVADKDHKAVKSANGVYVTRFWVGKKTPSEWSRSRDPLLIIGRPFGDYDAETSEKVLADFYLINAELADNQYSVRFTLSGPGIKEPKERLIAEWLPALIWAPSNGEHTLKAELLDPKGKPVDARWNPAVRTFNVRGSQ